MPERKGASAHGERVREREGRLCVSRQVGELTTGEIVQHYSTWEQTYGDPIRLEVVKVEYAPHDDEHRLLVTWRDPSDTDGDQTRETREPREKRVDVIVGLPRRPESQTRSEILHVAICSTSGCTCEPDGDGAEWAPTPERAIAAAIAEANWKRMPDGRLLCENCWTAEDPELAAP